MKTVKELLVWQDIVGLSYDPGISIVIQQAFIILLQSQSTQCLAGM
jgi:hypothetical protein